MLLIYVQLLILGALCLGWMYWLNQLTTDGTWNWRRSFFLFSVGFAAQIILLQNLTYLNVPIKYTFPIPALIGLAGLWRLFELWKRTTEVDTAFRLNVRYGAVIFLAVFSLQSASGLLEGPTGYYGAAHIDHFNYTTISEFLRTEPFSMPESEMQKLPWLVKASTYKQMRIGQSVEQAYVASLSFVSAKESYAGLCSFLLALLAGSVFILAQSFSLSRPYCVIAALWVGLAPATTKIHLDGFLSQASVLFLFPLIIVWARLTGESLRFKITTGAILLSYLLVCYTEYFIIGLFLLTLLTLALTVLWSRRQLMISAVVTGLSLLLVPAYLPRAYTFAATQYTVASKRNPALEVLATDGGTVYGWAKTLIAIPIAAPPLEREVTTAGGFILLALCVAGVFSRSRRNQLFLAAATLTPVVFLGILLSAQVVAKYPFMKISESFVFVWVLLAMRAISLIGVWAHRQFGPRAPVMLRAVPSVFFLLAFCGFFAQHKLIADRGNGTLSLLNRREFKDTLQYIANHPERVYIVRCPDGLVAGWISYQGRFSNVYILSTAISDVPLTPGSLAFTKVPEGIESSRITSVNTEGYHDITTSGGIPDMEIINPQGQDGSNSTLWYWLGDNMTVEVFRWTGDQPQEYLLNFRAEAGPAHPSPNRTIAITNTRTGEEKSFSFSGATTVTVPIVLLQGKNLFQIESIDPIEHVNHLPNDARKHMSRLLDFKLGPPKPLRDNDPRLSQTADLARLPIVRPTNPQGEDQGGGQSWYWIGKQMDVEVIRTDEDPKNVSYQLSFDAEAGPSNPDPQRKLRIRNTSDKGATDFTFSGSGKAIATFTAAPGSTHLTIEVVSPTVQKVHIPNDPRILMVRAFNFNVQRIRAKVPPAKPAQKAREAIPALTTK